MWGDDEIKGKRGVFSRLFFETAGAFFRRRRRERPSDLMNFDSARNMRHGLSIDAFGRLSTVIRDGTPFAFA